MPRLPVVAGGPDVQQQAAHQHADHPGRGERALRQGHRLPDRGANRQGFYIPPTTTPTYTAGGTGRGSGLGRPRGLGGRARGRWPPGGAGQRGGRRRVEGIGRDGEAARARDGNRARERGRLGGQAAGRMGRGGQRRGGYGRAWGGGRRGSGAQGTWR